MLGIHIAGISQKKTPLFTSLGRAKKKLDLPDLFKNPGGKDDVA